MRRIWWMAVVAVLVLVATPGAADPPAPAEPGAVVEWIFFDSGQAAIKPDFDAPLKSLAGKIQAGAETRVEVRGYTDSLEAEGDGRALAARRIEAVLERLRTLGVDVASVTRRVKAQADPWGDNASAQGRALNRRVDVAHSRVAAERTVAAPPQPVMEIPEKVYQFAPAVEGAVVAYAFTVRNRGSADLKITKVRTG